VAGNPGSLGMTKERVTVRWKAITEGNEFCIILGRRRSVENICRKGPQEPQIPPRQAGTDGLRSQQGLKPNDV
jgi:hypothetical protein